jgi:hypothetical protein
VEKQIIFWVATFGIWSLFVAIRFELDPIVWDRLTIAVTYMNMALGENGVVFDSLSLVSLSKTW